MRVLRLIVTKRVKPVKVGRVDILNVLIPMLSVLIGVLITTLIFYIAGVTPDIILKELFLGFTSPQMVRYFVLLTVLGIALALAFNASIWNIGAEGQMIWGMIAAGYIGLFIASTYMYVSPSELKLYENMSGAVIIDRSPVKPVVSLLNMDPLLGQLLMVLAGVVAGGLWALIPAVLKAYLDIDEVASTLLLNYVAYYLYNQVVSVNLRGLSVQARQFFRTDILHDALRFQSVPGFTVTYQEVLIALISFTAIFLMYKYTSIGLRLKVLGSNPHLLRAVGVDERKYVLLALFLSGALAGAVGASLFAGVTYKLEKITNIVSPPTMGLGYTAILVTWLSMLDLRIIPIFAWIVASLFQSGMLLESEVKSLGITSLTGATISYTLIGSILVTFTIFRIFSEYTIKVRR